MNSSLSDTALLIGRIALVVIFVMSGAQKLMDLNSVAGMIGSKGLPQPMALAAIAGLAELLGGLLIVIGFKTRLVSLGLIVLTAVATYYFHDFWNQPEGQEQMNNMIHAMKNLSIIGAFLMLAGAGPGRFSVDRR